MRPDVVVDVGNTRIKWGRCGADRVVDVARLSPDSPDVWQRQVETWNLLPGAAWFLAGVHPRRRDALADWLRERAFAVHVLDSYRELPLEVCVEAPERVGIDRLLNAVAVNAVRGSEAAVIVDAGSAVTVDLVDASGAFRGGAIFPGLRLMAEALRGYTAQLPLIEVKEIAAYPGMSTEKAMAVGILSAVSGGIERLARQSGAEQIFMTGGDADELSRVMQLPARVWAEMTLEGVRLAATHFPGA